MSTANDQTPEPEPKTPKACVFLSCEVSTPPVPEATRRRIGFLLRSLQDGETLGPPISKPMGIIGANCHELRLSDERGEWRVIYQVRETVIFVAEVFRKKTQATPKEVIDRCRKRFKEAVPPAPAE